jgi:hypothetical protein
MQHDDTIYIKEKLTEMVTILQEIKDILKEQKTKRDNQLPRKNY